MSVLIGVRSNKESAQKHTQYCGSLFDSANGVTEVTRDLVIFIYSNYSLGKTMTTSKENN